MKGVYLFIGFLLPFLAAGQDYHAITGSNYAGALGGHQNPASIANTPYPWDITILGFQTKYQTNAITVIDYSLLSSPANSKFIINGGSYGRYGNEQTNLNLLNTRIALKRKRSIAFGLNLRSIANIDTEPYNYKDTISSIYSFFSLNKGIGLLGGQAKATGLAEIYLTYAQRMIEHQNYRLNGGITVRVNRGFAGVTANINSLQHQTINETGTEDYLLNGGNINYGYSSNFDPWENNQSGGDKMNGFLNGTKFGFSVDAGLELIIKPGGVPGYMDDEESYYDYDWKISASLMDVGLAKYLYGENSRKGSIPATGFTASTLDTKLDSTITGLSELNDSLSTLMTLQEVGGYFNMFNPVRMVLNVDRFIWGGWFVNAELAINIGSLLGKKRLYVKDMNMLRVTPRWETRRWGAYLPITVNTKGQLWVGAAGKAGPLLIGFHNLGNVFSKNKLANGGGYITLTIRPGEAVTGNRKQKQFDCPTY